MNAWYIALAFFVFSSALIIGWAWFVYTAEIKVEKPPYIVSTYGENRYVIRKYYKDGNRYDLCSEGLNPKSNGFFGFATMGEAIEIAVELTNKHNATIKHEQEGQVWP